MKTKYENLINEIKKMKNHEDGIYEILLADRRDDDRGTIKLDEVRLNHDSTKIIVILYNQDDLGTMADKLIKAESMMDIALENLRYKKASPNLVEALRHNIPELFYKNRC